MPAARALIVDDSRTAQHRLKKLLNRYNLEVDTATSAEEALGYLSYKMPSVIFMDHHMEGMDGFEALKIIKANPSTATIPVIMYTSQSDDVYAGQAHALGALDTLSKNLMKPSRIEEVLSKLSMIPTGEEEPAEQVVQTEIPPIASQPHTSEQVQSVFDTSELKAQIARLFELHIADVRSQITENTKFIVRRLASEIKNSSNKDHRDDDVPLSILHEEAKSENAKNALVSNALLCLILVALAAVSFQVFQSQKQLNDLKDQYNQLADINYQESLLLDDLVVANRVERPISDTGSSRALLEALEWSMGIDMHFDFGEEPLGEKNILNLQNLAFRLYEAGFQGFIELNLHLGNFCLAPTDDGGVLNLAPNDLPLSDCQFLEEQKVDLSAENYTNIAYVQFEQSTAPIQNGDIEFIINISAFENPMYAYPDTLASATAGEWNDVARRNQLVTLSIESAL